MEYLSEYWNTVNDDMMFDEVHPSYLLLGLVSVGILILATYRLIGLANWRRLLNHGEMRRKR